MHVLQNKNNSTLANQYRSGLIFKTPRSSSRKKKRNYEEDCESKAFHDWLTKMKIPHDYSSHGEERVAKTIVNSKGEEIRVCPAGKRLKDLGASEGFPDFTITVPNPYHHGLYIEMKKRKDGRATPAQIAWRDTLIDWGYCAAICNGWDEAKALTEKYLSFRKSSKNVSYFRKIW